MTRLEEELFKLRLMAEPGEALRFDALVQQCGALSPSELDLAALLRCLDDGTQHHEVMWGLLHLIESFETTHRLRTLLVESAGLYATARDWLDLMVIGTLNHPTEAFSLLAVLLDHHQDECRHLDDALARIAEANKAPAAKARALRVAVATQRDTRRT